VGQATEILAMFGLAALLGRFRLKWILAGGLTFALVRYVLFALNTGAGVLTGIALHGLAFTLFFITTPIYLGERVDPAWRGRAQALMTLMSSGVGNLVGYLGTGWWMEACRGAAGGTDWTRFWGGLAIVLAAVLVYFLRAYRGRPKAGLVPAPGTTGRDA
jgi:MFS family permease